MRTIALQDLRSMVGEELGVSPWLAVSQEQINAFADLTVDHQWIHIDVERASREIGGTIAHGFLLLSLMTVLGVSVVVTGQSRGLNYGFNRIRFISPVRAGASIRMRQTLSGFAAKDDAFLMTRACSIEIADEPRPAVVAEWLTLHYP
jgi:acyl dehydratase